MDGNDAPVSHPWPEPPPEGRATEIAPGILWMRMPLPMVLDHVNVYALEDGDGWTVVDTGTDTRRSRAIWGRLLAGPLGGRPVRRVLVTHHHPDHIGLAGWFQAEHGAELWTTRTAWLLARMLCLDVQDRPLPETLLFMQRAGMPAEMRARFASERPFNFADVVAPLPLGFRRIEQGDTLRLAGRDWAVHMGDGHAPEHATLWSATGDLVIGGDQLLPGISPNLSVHPTEPEADPVGEWLDSCARLAKLARGAHLVLPGHKLPFTGLPIRLRQKMENHHGALARLLAHLSEPRIAPDCFGLLFKREIDGGTYRLALGETVAHLNHLHRTDRVRRWLRDDGAWTWQRRDAV